MKSRIPAQALVLSAASMLTLLAPLTVQPHKAQALGSACKDAIFTVTNNVTHNGKAVPITVKKFELWSNQEGRWLNEDFQDKEVPAGAANYVVRDGEDIENAENDDLTKVKVHYKVQIYGEWINFEATDSDVNFPTCNKVGKKYNATINRNL
ncbi:MAG: hypothetical protein B0A82_25780 [Alkalinema sp. CACIAM 70d]|nr:MAG: hypothetical protein B0A82_25780 [Alkalinema sp. CACIAM 70d]